jgi:adenosylmethionine-8-amino-7-oxononanoate aminotransferase
MILQLGHTLGGSIKIWDPDGNQLKHVLDAHAGWISSVLGWLNQDMDGKLDAIC